MKRLFQLDFRSVGGTQVLFFEDKQEAKHHRDMFAQDNGHTVGVKLGPDHWRYGMKNTPRTHSHNARSGGHGNGFPNKKKK